MQMNVEVGGRAEALDAGDSTGIGLESNWILGVLGRELLLWGASQSRMPAFKRFSQVTVQNVDPHLQ